MPKDQEKPVEGMEKRNVCEEKRTPVDELAKSEEEMSKEASAMFHRTFVQPLGPKQGDK